MTAPEQSTIQAETEIAALIETCVARWAAGGPDAAHALAPLVELCGDPGTAQLAVVVFAERLCALLGTAAAHLDGDVFTLWSQVTARFHDPATGDLLAIAP
jgi:hypothetical protein